MMRTLSFFLTLLFVMPLGLSAQSAHSLNFDGTDDYISINDIASYSVGSTFTLSIWFKQDPFSSGDEVLISKFGTGGQNGSLYEYSIYEGGGTMVFGIKTGNGALNINFPLNTLTPGAWHYITGVYDGANSILYANGVQRASSTHTGNIPETSEPIQLGRYFGGQYYGGSLDGIELWNMALSDSQIVQYMNCPPTGSEAGLVGYWNLETGSGATAINKTANANNGVITGTVWNKDAPSCSCSPVGIVKENRKKEFRLFPNPTAGRFTLIGEIPDVGKSHHLAVFDLTGKAVKRAAMVGAAKTIDLSGCAPGIYFVRLDDEKGMPVFSGKLVLAQQR